MVYVICHAYGTLYNVFTVNLLNHEISFLQLPAKQEIQDPTNPVSNFRSYTPDRIN